MKDLKEEHIDPEQYWPGAASLLENHYKAKRRRRAIVLLSTVLIGLLSVYFISTERSQLAEKRTANKNEKASDVSAQNKFVAPNDNKSIIPSKEGEENKELNKEERKEVNPSTEVENERAGATMPSKKRTSSPKINALDAVAKNENNFGVTSKSSEQHVATMTSNSKSAVISSPSSTQGKQTNVSDFNTKSHSDQNIVSSESSNTTTHFGDVDYVAAMPMLKWKDTPLEESSIQPDNRPGLQNKKKAKWDLLVYAGVNDVQKELSGKSSSSYLLRREKEEAPALLPFGGLQLSRSINNWDFRGGVEFAVVGEQVKYSPYSKGDYLSVYDDWVPNNYIVTDTDSAYIWGILFLNTTDYTVIDSVNVTVTDTLNGVHYNSSIRNANGTNRWYVMELPLEVVYQFRMKRWGIGISAGIAPGLVVQSSGYYLKEDESGYASIEKYNKQQFTLNARAGIEFSYLLNTRCRLLLRPTSQYSLLKMDAGTNERQRYRRNGISLGLLYMIP